MSTSPSVVSQEPSLYEDDLHEWASRQAALIREKRIDEPILCILLKNLMTLGSELYRRLESAFTVLFAHMLKWDHQPESRSRIWEATTREQRKRAGEEPFLEIEVGGGHGGRLRIWPRPRVRPERLAFGKLSRKIELLDPRRHGSRISPGRVRPLPRQWSGQRRLTPQAWSMSVWSRRIYRSLDHRLRLGCCGL